LTKSSMNHVLASKLLFYGQAISCKLICAFYTIFLIFQSFMRPGVPHFVYGPEHTLCYGGHFYTTSLMQATLTSLAHSFIVGDLITNATHHPSRSLLRRIVLLFHVGLMEHQFHHTGRYPSTVFLVHPSNGVCRG
jgi:hypothetical protein